ncbi:sodium:solute symporter family transporter [Allorhodopirellula solitaria]|uniref:Sodium/glucose cotransporter n=1 Tax=Allorhodopirellula solitaria TaxID=2527987 RepID=A0A5C5XUJ6_9BACT|nr:sodium/solute symporter [Allorhodopirellula solitaria]TWT65272.1 Sodium/glucose cotransporter [Allorhodopirellula solitaria]
MKHVSKWLISIGMLVALLMGERPSLTADDNVLLSWSELPSLPDELGLAGPFAGVHNDALIVAGGANFPKPVWDNDKVWHDRIFVLTKDGDQYQWHEGGRLRQRLAYGAAVSTPDGVLCMGGNDTSETFGETFLLSWDPESEQMTKTEYPPLPQPCAYSTATMIGDVVYLAGGQSGTSLESAMTNFWSLDLSKKSSEEAFVWQELPPWPGPSRAFNLTISQHNGYNDCVYVISGRRQEGDADDPASFDFLTDVWEFNPSNRSWRRRADVPRCVMAGTGIGFGQSHIFVLGGATGERFFQGDELRDDHPGFLKESLAYHTITNTWTSAGPTPANHVTTTAVRWGDDIIVPTGEVRPRVRSPKVFRVSAVRPSRGFGTINYIVLFGYLFSMVGVGVYFANKNKSTDDYFRGGGHVPWWAAGCSIFATMLSSLTFTGVPSKSFAQDWVYAVGNMMIPVVAILAVSVAMPFFRRIDATSAYEYLEKRFSRPVRLFGSASFTMFHIFRMAVVMSLTGLALAVATPLTPGQSVLLMGVLSIAYCTMGGIEAVIWTDTIQTFVLMGGALLAIGILIAGVDGGFGGFLSTATDADKFTIANFHWDMTSSQVALWVILVGSIAQNVSSYTADQAVVQRYMTTANETLAARSIWTNAVLTIPATILFFGIGTALFAYYHSHPDKLDPTITTDQVFPLFIAREMPIGLAGLIVAGIFAAAQSTVSTSMNSTATAIVTDFMRPFGACRSEAGYLRAARFWTFLIGVVGTLLGLVFVNPEIKSLFDAFIKVIGLFMGVLGGLFILGAVTRRANATGALTGALVGAGAMFWLWKFTAVNGYLYTASGIVSCLVVGLAVSLVTGRPTNDLSGLTIYTLGKPVRPSE